MYVFMEKYGKLSPNCPCYPFLSGTLIKGFVLSDEKLLQIHVRSGNM